MHHRKTKSKKVITILLAVICVVSLCFNTSPNAYALSGPDITAEAAIVIDFLSGEVLYERDADRMIAPASMTKMMTLYIVYEAIAEGRLCFDTRLIPSQRAVDLSRDSFNTNVALNAGTSYTVLELIDASVSISAAGATLVLVEQIAGSSANFLEIMNDKVELWGIDAIFFSTIGGTTHTRMTPRAMSVITRNFIMRFPEILERTGRRTITFAGPHNVHPTTNHLLGHYEGLDGFKTGTSMESLENFAATAERDGVRLISVVMRSRWDNRFDDTAALLDYGFAVASPNTDNILIIPEYYQKSDINFPGVTVLREEEIEEYREPDAFDLFLAELALENNPEHQEDSELELLAQPVSDEPITKPSEPSQDESAQGQGISFGGIVSIFLGVQICVGLVVYSVIKAKK